jgi:hypothetical protein
MKKRVAKRVIKIGKLDKEFLESNKIIVGDFIIFNFVKKN